MQFNWKDLSSEKDQFVEAIKNGCKKCGYEADVVSQNHADQITDRIIAEIKGAKFIIADFTFNNQGVYYEAGFARGLGKKVIHTERKDHTNHLEDLFKKLHFGLYKTN